MNEQAYNLKFGDLDVRVKPVVDAKHEGMIDPRLYPEVKNLGWLRFIPKRFLKIELKPKTLEVLRKGFDSVDSAVMVAESLDIKTLHIRRDDTDLRMRINRRDDSIENAPVLYFIHGGGFFAGRTEVIEEAMKLLVSRFDVVAFSLDYRLAPEHPYPVGHEDTYFGFKWVLDHASEYGGNPQNIFIGGDSAGGNFTQYCTNKALEEGVEAISGQILLYPTVNMGKVKDMYTELNFDALKPYKKHYHASQVLINMMQNAMGMLHVILDVTDVSIWELTPYIKVRNDLPPTLQVGNLMA